uniref:Uncharacterized protein n=1 Tax=Haemonchus contortus TaxID=6289 RepID=A0A7I4YV21_HAECO
MSRIPHEASEDIRSDRRSRSTVLFGVIESPKDLNPSLKQCDLETKESTRQKIDEREHRKLRKEQAKSEDELDEANSGCAELHRIVKR